MSIFGCWHMCQSALPGLGAWDLEIGMFLLTGAVPVNPQTWLRLVMLIPSPISHNLWKISLSRH